MVRLYVKSFRGDVDYVGEDLRQGREGQVIVLELDVVLTCLTERLTLEGVCLSLSLSVSALSLSLSLSLSLYLSIYLSL